MLIGLMTYRTLLTMALFTSLSIGAVGVGFAVFTDKHSAKYTAGYSSVPAGQVQASSPEST